MALASVTVYPREPGARAKLERRNPYDPVRGGSHIVGKPAGQPLVLLLDVDELGALMFRAVATFCCVEALCATDAYEARLLSIDGSISVSTQRSTSSTASCAIVVGAMSSGWCWWELCMKQETFLSYGCCVMGAS